MELEIVNRKDAKARGLIRYFTGKPCKNGHLSEKYTSIGRCCECQRQRRLVEVKDRKTENKRVKKWRAANRDKCKQYSKRDIAKHGEKRRAKIKEWECNNPDKVRASRKCCDNNRRKAEGKFTTSDVMRIGKLQNWLCAYCKIDVSKSYCVDHIQPLAKGGTNWPRNLQLACGLCNSRKSAKDPMDWAREIGLLL